GPRIIEDGFTVTRLIVAATDKSPDGHAGRLASPDAADAVFDHEGMARVRPHPFGRVQEQIRRGLAAFHHLRGIEPAVEVRREAGEGKRQRYPISIAGGGDAVWDLQTLQHR